MRWSATVGQSFQDDCARVRTSFGENKQAPPTRRSKKAAAQAEARSGEGLACATPLPALSLNNCSAWRTCADWALAALLLLVSVAVSEPASAAAGGRGGGGGVGVVLLSCAAEAPSRAATSRAAELICTVTLGGASAWRSGAPAGFGVSTRFWGEVSSAGVLTRAEDKALTASIMVISWPDTAGVSGKLRVRLVISDAGPDSLQGVYFPAGTLTIRFGSRMRAPTSSRP